MSSLLRRIQRQVSPSRAGYTDKDGKFHPNPPREVFYQGRGRKLGVVNPKDPARIAREKREAKRRAARGEG